MSKPETKFYLRKGNKYITESDTFTAPAFGHESAKAFDTEDAALDKAEALGIDLDRVTVVEAKVREPRRA